MPFPHRSARGVTTAEYVGIVALVGLIVVAVIALAPGVSDTANAGIKRIYCGITSTFGGGGCGPEDNPYYEPDDCTVGTSSEGAGGSIDISIIEVGADGQWTIAEVNYLDENGQPATEYVVTQQVEGNVDAEFQVGGSADTGGQGGTGAEAGVNIGLQGAMGESFVFDSLAEAQNHVDTWENSIDPWPGPSGYDPPSADTTFYEGGVHAGIDAEVPGGEISGSTALVVGYTQHHETGNQTVSFTMENEAAIEAGIPIPESIMELSAQAGGSSELGVNATFDSDGNLVEVQVTVVATVEAGTDLGVGGEGLDTALEGTNVEDLQLPGVDLDPNLPGVQAQATFTSNFENNPQATDALLNILSGQSLTEAQQQALHTQLNEHSQITAGVYSYESDESQYGAGIHWGPVALGGEIHFTSSNTDILGGWYYNPNTGSWQQNTLCEA